MKENRVQDFLNEAFGEVRALNEKGNLWFCGYDIAKILGYANPSKTISTKITDITKTVRSNNTNITMITEKSLYKLVFGSKMEKAEEFQDWICGVVIPTLRKDGMYLDGEENVTSQDELIKLGYEALMQKCERLEKQLTKGNVIFYKTNKTYKDVHECAKETGYDVTTIRNHCRGVGGIKDRQFGYVGAVYNGSGELWVRCLNTGEIMATEKYFDKKYDMPHGTTKNICLGKIESFDGLNFIYEEHEKDGTYYYKQG